MYYIFFFDFMVERMNEKCNYSGISLKWTRYKADTPVGRTVVLGTDGS